MRDVFLNNYIMNQNVILLIFQKYITEESD